MEIIRDIAVSIQTLFTGDFFKSLENNKVSFQYFNIYTCTLRCTTLPICTTWYNTNIISHDVNVNQTQNEIDMGMTNFKSAK